MGRLSKAMVIEAAKKGLVNAQATYEDWSGGDWVSESGVEHLITTTISREIMESIGADRVNFLLTLEEPFWRLAGSVGENLRGKTGPKRKALASESARADIALWRNSGEVWGAIEVKRGFARSRLLDDAARLRSLLDTYGGKYEGSVQFAALAVSLSYAHDAAGKKMMARYRDIEALIKKKFGPVKAHIIKPYQSKFHADDSHYGKYSLGGILVEFKPNQ